MGKQLISHIPFILFMIFYILYEGYFSYYSFDLVNRASLSALATAILSFLISWETLQDPDRRSIPYKAFAGIFLTHGLFNFLRSFLLFFIPGENSFFQGGGMTKLLFSELLVFIFAITLGYIFLISGRLVERLRQQAEIDHLTEIFNTRALSKLAEKALSMARRKDTILSVLLIDIDHFKGINDSYGHAAGDTLLRDFANILSRNIRPSDVVGRMGGEEFTILLPDTDKVEAFQVAERLRCIVETNRFSHKNTSIQFTISVGITSSEGKEKDFDLIMREADTALYHAKREGRNKAVPYDESDHVQQRLFLSF
jgi:diguanylate cyclase (GGDEF)-like protein